MRSSGRRTGRGRLSRLCTPVDVLADAPDAGHLLLVEGSGVQGLEIVLHLRCGGGARDTHVHVGMGENDVANASIIFEQPPSRK
jgi:hypothetical protein